MKVYFVYAKMTDAEYAHYNRYGQYDVFIEGKHMEDYYVVLWGFTTSKKILKEFFTQRTISNRYYAKGVNMDDVEFDKFMMDKFRYELLPYAYDMNNTIGDKGGYLIENTAAIIYSKNLPEKEHYCMRISTRYEYDFIVNNCGEILSCRMSNFFLKYSLPMSIDIFKDPLREFLERSGYLLEALTYHPLSVEYMNENPRMREAYKEMEMGSIQRNDECSMLKLLYITFSEMFYERVE